MKATLDAIAISEYVSGQLNQFFPDRRSVDCRQYWPALTEALDRVEHCFGHSALRHYCEAGQAKFNHLFSDQYAAFIWLFGNSIWRRSQTQQDPVLDKLFYLNKTLHGLEVMHNTQPPDIFVFSHTVGTVLGKASYSDFLVVSHGCTVGNHKGVYPVLDAGVGLAANVSVIGDCRIGKRVSIGSNTHIFHTSMPDDTTAYTSGAGALTFRASTAPYAQKFFLDDLSRL